MQILLALSAIIAVSTARVVITAEGPTDLHLLGQEECTWGPSYWCENIKTAAGCNATKHCIKTVWNHMKVPEDNDDVCTVCKDMVQQARDQLESNQTQSDLKAVFEGSCRLMRIKPVVNECIKIVDQFIPDLVETLASQMNPSVVCSVAGLCNSAHIDKLLEESPIKVAEMKVHSLGDDEIEPDECTKCYTIATHMEHKLKNTPRDKMLQQMLSSCAEFNTFTDACSAIILTNFETIYTHLQENFNAQNICHLSGQCSGKFHKHEDGHKTPEVEIRPLSSVGMVEVGDDLPCKLCEQLVGHLRDLLVANTTEAEFRLVLDGLCKQTKSFSSECTAIVDEYYPEIYEYLTKGLNSNAVCQMSGICPSPGKGMQDEPIWPLLPNNVAEVGVRMLKDSKKKFEKEKQQELSEAEVESMQLPIERMLPFPISEGPLTVHGKVSCALCEYVLHYIQDSITNPVTEDKVKHAIEEVCMKLPGTIRGECSEFVDTYGDAIVAILAQEIDPSQACPMLHFCPSQQLMNMWESVPSKYMIEEQKNKKPSCPLCLLAVSQVYNIIKNNKTEANIESVLDKLCIHLPRSLSEECTDLVKGYSKELVDLLLADLSPQEVCVYIKLCDDNKNTGPRNLFITDNSGEILTNEIPDTSVNFEIENDEGATCVVCEYAMRFVDKELGSEKARNKVENSVRTVCKHLPKTLSQSCGQFVNKYGDAIINVITKDVSPKQVCKFMGLCALYMQEEFEAIDNDQETSVNFEISADTEGATCTVCEYVIKFIEKALGSEKGKNKVTGTVRGACKHIPKSLSGKCNDLISKHGNNIIDMIVQNVSPRSVCKLIRVCSTYMQVDFEAIDEVPETSESSEIWEEEDKAITCTVCELGMKVVDKAIGSKKGKDAIEGAVRGVCKHLPKFISRPCKKFINNHGDAAVNAIVKGASPKNVCGLIGICSAYMIEEIEAIDKIQESLVDSEISEDTEGATCTVCEYAINFIEKELGSERGKNKVEGTVHGVCKHFPKTLSRECNNFVNKHGDDIINKIVQNVSPRSVCKLIRVCSTYMQVDFEVIDEVPETSESSEIWEEEDKAITCTVCELSMKVVDKAIGSNKGKDVIEGAVRGVCKHLPKSISRPCKKFINNHGDAAVNAIVKGASPKNVCGLIGLCSAYMIEEIEAIDKIQESLVDSEISEDTEGATCTVCEYAISFIEKELGSERGKNKVEGTVHGVCKHFPKTLSRECNNFINKHGDDIINKIVQNVSPRSVCKLIRVCSTYMQVDFEVIEEAPDTFESTDISEDTNLGPTCVVCDYALRFIEKKLGSEKAKDKVEDAVRGVCKHLPKTLSHDCNKFVNKHGDTVINVIVQGMSPKTVCTLAGLCVLYKEEEFKASVVECATCKGVISVIDELLANPKVDDTILNVVSKACKHVPASKQSKCATLINIYGHSIINLIEQHTDSKKVCGKIGLCAPADYSSISLESARSKRSYEKDDIKRCTWGPVYWCSSNETALKCKAVEHCKENVWKAEFAPPKQITFSAAEPNA